MERYSPTTDFIGGGSGWTIVGAPTGYQATDDDPRLPVNATDYITSLANNEFNAGMLFDIPSYYAPTINYGDGTTGVNFGITSVRIVADVSLSAPGPASLNTLTADSLSQVGIAATTSITSVTPLVQRVDITLPTNPATGNPWQISEVAPGAANFGVLFSGIASNPAVNFRVLRLFIEIIPNEFGDNNQARRTPNQHEPTYNCAVCSVPFPRSRLMKAEDSRHPLYGRLICPEDFDDLNLDDEFATRRREGDIDFDS